MQKDSLLKVGSWNTWSGCVADACCDGDHVIDYIAEKAQENDILGLYEVHQLRKPSSVRFATVKDSKGRVGRLDLELGERLMTRLSRSHRLHFVSHFAETAFHDCEPTTEPVDYGNMVLIKKELCRRPNKISIENVHIFGTGHLNSECVVTKLGRPASRNGIIVTLWLRTQPISLLFVHGLWSRQGKIDLPARTAQSAYIAKAFIQHRQRLRIKPIAGANVLLGDLNLTSQLGAMEQLLGRTDVFGDGGGHNLLTEIDTRTEFYPADKPSREANFVLVSQAVFPWVKECKIEQTAPSDHAFIQLTLDSTLGTN